MSLLARRRAMTRKLALKERLRREFSGSGEIEKLFGGAASLDEVIDLLATTFLHSASEEQAEAHSSLAQILVAGLVHCRERLNSDQLLTQAEYLLVTLAETVAAAPDCGPESQLRGRDLITCECRAIHEQLRNRRREQMNMGREQDTRVD